MSFSQLLRAGALLAVLLAAIAWPGEPGTGGPPGAPRPAHAGPPYDFTLVTVAIQNALPGISNGGASFIVVRDGVEVYKQHFGTFSDATGAFVASSSKWYSAAAFMTLVDDGIVDLNDTVNMYLPDWTGPHGSATLRQLWSHTSGMAFTHDCLANATLTLAQCVDQIRDTPAAFFAPPGTGFYYGQVGMQVGARIAEIATGQTWEQLFTERIITPLGMQYTAWWPSQANPQVGGGGFTTLHDYNNFLQMIDDNGMFGGEEVLSSGAIAAMQADNTLGLPILWSPAGHSRYGLGEWRDIVDAGGAAVQVSSPGLFGSLPWVDNERDYHAMFLVQASPGQVTTLQSMVMQLTRDAVGGDGDGCIDAEELGTTPSLGGLRDPAFRWDFYEVNGTLKIDAVDIGLVRANFNPSGPIAPEDVIYDRSPGAATWAPGAPDNRINAIDIGLVRASFNHTCAAAP
jgi:CubicO group peptidase (beta-lactamase class C family)